MPIFKRYCHLCMEKQRKYRKCPTCKRAICRSCLAEMKEVGVTDCPYCDTRIIAVEIVKPERLPPVVRLETNAPPPIWSKPTPHQFNMMMDHTTKPKQAKVINWPIVLEFIQRNPTTINNLYEKIAEQMKKVGRTPINKGVLWTQMMKWAQAGDLRKAMDNQSRVWYGPPQKQPDRTADILDSLEYAIKK